MKIFKKTKIGQIYSKDGDKFFIFAGLDKKLVAELKALSLNKKDKELQKNTGDLKRFGLGSYSEWYKKNRTPFALVHEKTGALAGLVWFGPKALGEKSIKYGIEGKKVKKESKKNTWHTIAYRAYPPFRGKGITKKFTAFATDVYMKNFPNIKVWAGIDDRNKASQKLSEGLGFKTLEKLSDKKAHWLVMVKY